MALSQFLIGPWGGGKNLIHRLACLVGSFCVKDHNPNLCRELHRILRCDPFTVKGACQLLQLSADAEEAQVKKVREELKQKLAKTQLQAGEEPIQENRKRNHKKHKLLRNNNKSCQLISRFSFCVGKKRTS